MHRTDSGSPAAGSAATTSRTLIDRSANSSLSLQRSTSVTATHSTSFAVRRSKSKQFRSQASLDSAPVMISPEEYAALPASIQKKYFSSKERLCIAQQSAAQRRKKQHGKLGSWLLSTSTSDLSTQTSTSAGLHSIKPKTRSHDPKLFLVRFDEDSVSEEEARWFLSLPEKIKTKRFSREELVSLTAISHRVLAKASETTKRDSVQRRRSVHRFETSTFVHIGTAISSSTNSITDRNNFHAPPAGTNEAKQAKSTANNPTRISTEVVDISEIKRPLHDELSAETDRAVETVTNASDAEMEILKLYLQRRSLKAKASDSRVKRSPPDSPPTTSAQPSKKRFHHRLHMLTPLPLPPPVLAPAPRAQASTPFSTSARLSRPFLNNDPLGTDEDADTDEKQLSDESQGADGTQPILVRDEGQIFELAANEEVLPISTDEDCPYPHLVSAFSDDGTDYEKDIDDNLDAESVETVGPRTPSPLDHRDSALQQATGDSGIDIPEFHVDSRSKASSLLDRNSSSLSNYGSNHDSIGSRAHVLGTSSEEILYAYQRRLTSGVDVEMSDPLALQTLPVCDDETGAKGAFAVAGSNEGSTKAPSKLLKGVLRSFPRL